MSELCTIFRTFLIYYPRIRNPKLQGSDFKRLVRKFNPAKNFVAYFLTKFLNVLRRVLGRSSAPQVIVPKGNEEAVTVPGEQPSTEQPTKGLPNFIRRTLKIIAEKVVELTTYGVTFAMIIYMIGVQFHFCFPKHTILERRGLKLQKESLIAKSSDGFKVDFYELDYSLASIEDTPPETKGIVLGLGHISKGIVNSNFKFGVLVNSQFIRSTIRECQFQNTDQRTSLFLDSRILKSNYESSNLAFSRWENTTARFDTLRKSNFYKMQSQNSTFYQCDFFYAILDHSTFSDHTYLYQSNFKFANFDQVHWDSVRVVDCKLKKSEHISAVYTGCDFLANSFHGAIFTGTAFESTRIRGNDFSISLFEGVIFADCNGRLSNYSGSRFINDTDIDNSDFSHSGFLSSTFSASECDSVDFSYCDFSGTTFANTRFSDCDFQHSRLDQSIIFDSLTVFQGCNFKGAHLSEEFRAFLVEQGNEVD